MNAGRDALESGHFRSVSAVNSGHGQQGRAPLPRLLLLSSRFFFDEKPEVGRSHRETSESFFNDLQEYHQSY